MMDRAESAVYWPFHWNHVVWLRCHLPLGRPSIRSKTCVKRIELINAPFFFWQPSAYKIATLCWRSPKSSSSSPSLALAMKIYWLGIWCDGMLKSRATRSSYMHQILFVLNGNPTQVFIHLAALLTRPNVTGAKSPDAPMRSLGLFDLTKCQL